MNQINCPQQTVRTAPASCLCDFEQPQQQLQEQHQHFVTFTMLTEITALCILVQTELERALVGLIYKNNFIPISTVYFANIAGTGPGP